LGFGFWVLGLGALPPTPNPQSPIPTIFFIKKIKKFKLKKIK
jgi:hypothetical protein